VSRTFIGEISKSAWPLATLTSWAWSRRIQGIDFYVYMLNAAMTGLTRHSALKELSQASREGDNGFIA
jgi:hypothetical protein